jgi:hypothetical protein
MSDTDKTQQPPETEIVHTTRIACDGAKDRWAIRGSGYLWMKTWAGSNAAIATSVSSTKKSDPLAF